MLGGSPKKTVTDYRDARYRSIAEVGRHEVFPMQAPANRDSWQSGFDSAIDEAIQMVDAMRAPGVSNMAAPILLRIRAELIALREHGPRAKQAA